MTGQAIRNDALFSEIHRLATACLEGGAAPATFQRLKDLVSGDPEALDLYVEYLSDSISLRCVVSTPTESEAMTLASLAELETDISVHPSACLPGQLSPAPAFLHNILGMFPEGMPLAYLIATVVTGLGIVIASHVYMSRPEQIATHSLPRAAERQIVPEPLPASVGRITGMVDCKWAEEKKGSDPICAKHPPGRSGKWGLTPFSPVALGDKFALSSGLMEITYDTGAKVILQGPVTYEVEANGGYLAVGKLTGKMEKNDKRGTLNAELSDRRSSFIVQRSAFVIRTPTATVTDLGTEFGVEVKQGGVSEVHLIQGEVKVQRVDQNDGTDEAVKLSEGQAVRVGPTQSGYTLIPAAPSRFRNMRIPLVKTPPLRWPLLDKTLVAWVSLAKLDQRGVGVLSLARIDSDRPKCNCIAFGDLGPRTWMAGIFDWWKLEKSQSAYPAETARWNELVQIAIVYDGTSATIYRNGEKYAEYEAENQRAFNKDSVLLIGKRYLGGNPEFCPTLAGAVEEARLYNVALSPQMIASLRPNEPSPIGPVGLWTFEDGTARDSTGHFPLGQLQGNARIANGKLILDGQESFLVIPAMGGIKEPTRVVNSDFERDYVPWYGQKLSDDSTALLPAPEMVSRATADTPDGSKGALCVSIVRDPRYKYLSHVCGAVCPLQETVPAGTTLRISFYAKSISGATWLNMCRHAGGSAAARVGIGPNWRHYQVEIPLGWIAPWTSHLVFSLVGSEVGASLALADGVFLLDQVRVDQVPNPAPGADAATRGVGPKAE